MKQNLVLLFSLLSLSCFSFLANAQNAPAEKPKALDINRIISTTKAAAANDRKINSQREKRFKGEKNKRQASLNGMRAERAKQERISNELDATFSSNEVQLKELQEELAKELGDLKELFGVIQQTASEAQEDYKTSIISAQFPDRASKLQQMAAKMGSTSELVSIDEIEELWFELQNEMTQQGKIVKFETPVSYVTGTELTDEGKEVKVYGQQDRTITRVGVFDAVTGNDIASYKNDKGLLLLERQMGSSYTSKSNDLQSASSGVTSFYLDPTKGGLVSALVKKPTIIEKIAEGKIVGYVIIGLGIIGVLLALYKILVLSGVEAKVKRQAKDTKKASLSNPLGRILKVFQDNRKSDSESMELKLGEAILKETPRLNSWLMFVKIIAVVAPLLGLLGTVTGMIQTFQAITLYGAGDPQMMAGGISQALVTTVLGLVVAIPTVLLHSSAAGRARRIANVLEENAAGLIARQIESEK